MKKFRYLTSCNSTTIRSRLSDQYWQVIHVSLTASLIILINLIPSSSIAGTTSELGKLFFNDTERKKIDDIRFKRIVINSKKSSSTINKKANQKPPTGKNSSNQKEQVSESIVVEGFIKRENGKSVIWYNNTNTLNSNKIKNNISIRSSILPDGSVGIISDNKNIIIKPGQSLNITTGKVTENYQDEDSAAKLKIEQE